MRPQYISMIFRHFFSCQFISMLLMSSFTCVFITSTRILHFFGYFLLFFLIFLCFFSTDSVFHLGTYINDVRLYFYELFSCFFNRIFYFSMLTRRKKTYTRRLTIDEVNQAIQSHSNEDEIAMINNADFIYEEEVPVDNVSENESDEEAEVNSVHSEEDEVIDEDLPEVNSYFGVDTTEWKKEPLAIPQADRPFRQLTGSLMLQEGQRLDTVLDCFELIFDNQTIDAIIFYTNKEALTHDANFKVIDQIEMKAFIGLLIIAGVDHSSKKNYEEFYGRLRGLPIFKATMALKRFKSILRFIRYDDKTTRVARRATDKLAAIREVFDNVVANLQKYYVPGAYMTVDEQMVPFYGRCAFKQFMPKKPDKYGMKIFWLCDSETSYPINAIAYLGIKTFFQYFKSSVYSNILYV